MKSHARLVASAALTLSLAGCTPASNSVQGGDVSFTLGGISFQPLLDTSWGTLADDGDLTFEWSNEEGPDDSPGFYIQWGGGEDGSYVVSSSAGAVDEESDESLWIRISLEPWEGAKTYSTLNGAEPTVLFDWTSAGEDDEGNFVDQSTFFLESSEGGSCETTVAPGGLSGSFACEGMSAVINDLLEPDGLLEISGSWTGTNQPY